VLVSSLLVAAQPASAQMPASLVSPASVLHEYVSVASAMPPRGDIPPNIEVSVIYRPVLVKMLGRSPTFRRQMLRIAAATHLTIHLRSGLPSWTQGLRARTDFVRTADGQLLANVDIVWSNSPVEIIAHELEHVIEQLDGVDLAVKVRQSNSGVYLAGDNGNLFETTRATRIGLQVAREVR
jgi:hypothetical protein